MSIKKLARNIYDLTRRESWLGGTVVYDHKEGKDHPGKSWPANVAPISPMWPAGHTWSLSPEVILNGYRLRLCVSMGAEAEVPRGRIFVDGEVKHPGGEFSVNWIWGDGWLRRIGRQQRAAGGKNGPVDIRDIAIQEAENKTKGMLSLGEEKPRVYCDLCHQALQELDQEFPNGNGAKE